MTKLSYLKIPNSTQPATKNVKIRYKVNPTTKQDLNSCKQNIKYEEANNRRIP